MSRANYIKKEHWELLFDAFEDGIYITDSKGLTLSVNKAYEQITGINPSRVIGRYMSDIVKDGVLSVSVSKMVLESGNEVTKEQETNTGKHLIIRAIPIKDDQGKIVLVMNIVRDITAVNKLQTELIKFRQIADKYKMELTQLTKGRYIAKSKGFKNAISLAHRVSNVDSTVLILGESGTGKEIVAREIHDHSQRAKNMFIKVNCGAIPENLLESELFGYVAGAFTGARPSGHMGVFEMADKGTIFLDEIGDLPLILQVKLLRVLQEKVIIRVGSSKAIQTDTRVIAATNRDLHQMVLEKTFREDLFYRLNVVPIKIPPLRERKEDIPPLVDFFVGRINRKYHMEKSISSELIKEFSEYDWPGNVRELENIIERLLVTSEENVISIENADFFWQKQKSIPYGLVISGILPLSEAHDIVTDYLLKEASKKYKTTYEIADALKISQPTVSRKLRNLKT